MGKEFNYEEFVDDCYENKKNQEIHNASEENALLLFNRLFDKAIRDKEDVRIISSILLARFYNELTNKLKKITESGNTVQVIVEEEVDDKGNNNFYKQSKSNLKIASNFEGLPNFIVVGDNAYRYETDKNSTKAVANFNNKNMGEFIKNLFDKINKDIITA